MTNADRKAAIRERMASTGENYTTAKRAIEQARDQARGRVSPQNDLALERAVYAEHDKGTVAGFLAQELFSTAVWREGKAAEYPDDDRNLPAAEHLAGLARQILALPDDDPRILRIEDAVQAIADANGELPATSEIIRTIGFSWGYPSLDDLLDHYVQEHKRELEQLKRYVADTQGDGAMPAAQRISEALNIGLDEVLAALQKVGSWVPAATLVRRGNADRRRSGGGRRSKGSRANGARDPCGCGCCDRRPRSGPPDRRQRAERAGFAGRTGPAERESADPGRRHPDRCRLPGAATRSAESHPRGRGASFGYRGCPGPP